MGAASPLQLPPLPSAACAVAVGLSCGLDSTVLLHLLAGSKSIRGKGLRAIHVHHGLHADASAWASQCRSFCDALEVELSIVEVQVDRDSGLGLEGAARKARRTAFAAQLRDGETLALAHHRDDQAETFLLRALRASGPDGLAAMRAWRSFGHGWLWRPLLDVPRGALLQYADAHGLRWIEDPGNDDCSLDRNFLRHRVLPLLRERWPQADLAFARGAALQGDAVDLLAREDAQALAATRTLDPRVLSVDALRRLPMPRRARVLRRWIGQLGLPPLPAEGVAAIEADLLDSAPDARPGFRWANAIVQRWRDLLHADRQTDPLSGDYRMPWDGGSPLALPTGDILHFEPAAAVGAASTASFADFTAFADHQVNSSRLKPLPQGPEGGFVVHARQGGERLTLPGRAHSHALKHVLQDLGVPPWERKRLPLLSDAEGRLLAAGDLAYAADFDAWLRSCGTRLVWQTV